MKSRFKSKFYLQSGVFAALSIGGAVLNYALYPALARVLPTDQFGDFTAILALSNQIFGLMLAFNLTSIYLVKTFPEEEARHKAQIVQKLLVWLFAILTIVIVTLSPLLKDLLNIRDVFSFVIMGLLLIITVPTVIWMGYLQGHKQLIRVGMFTLSAAFFKLVFTLAFATIWGVTGGLWGVLAGSVAGLIVMYLITFRHLKLPNMSAVTTPFTPEQKLFIRDFRAYIVLSTIIVGMLSILQSFDITLAKALFSPDEAGAYSGISVISSGLYHVSFLLIWILLPEIAVGNRKHNRQILGTAYKVIAAISIGAIGVILMFEDLITSLLLGSRFAGQSDILIYTSLYQLTLVAVTLQAYYLLVIRDRRAGILGLSVFIPALIVPRLLADDPKSMIVLLWTALLSGIVIYGIINLIVRSLHHGHQETSD